MNLSSIKTIPQSISKQIASNKTRKEQGKILDAAHDSFRKYELSKRPIEEQKEVFIRDAIPNTLKALREKAGNKIQSIIKKH